MNKAPIIRDTQVGEVDVLCHLYAKAFPAEDLTSLVTSLIGMEKACINLSAYCDDMLVGHIAFTSCALSASPVRVSLLGPLAVLPDYQHKGIGFALVKHGFERVKEAGHVLALVLGDPAYYGRFDFKEETDIKTPHPIPEDWLAGWQSVVLGPGAEKVSGDLIVPSPWQRPELWSDGVSCQDG